MKVQKLAPWLGPELAIPTLKTRPENTRALRGSVGGGWGWIYVRLQKVNEYGTHIKRPRKVQTVN